jgi:hypothetical protein
VERETWLIHDLTKWDIELETKLNREGGREVFGLTAGLPYVTVPQVPWDDPDGRWVAVNRLPGLEGWPDPASHDFLLSCRTAREWIEGRGEDFDAWVEEFERLEARPPKSGYPDAVGNRPAG